MTDMVYYLFNEDEMQKLLARGKERAEAVASGNPPEETEPEEPPTDQNGNPVYVDRGDGWADIFDSSLHPDAVNWGNKRLDCKAGVMKRVTVYAPEDMFGQTNRMRFANVDANAQMGAFEFYDTESGEMLNSGSFHQGAKCDYKIGPNREGRKYAIQVTMENDVNLLVAGSFHVQ